MQWTKTKENEWASGEWRIVRDDDLYFIYGPDWVTGSPLKGMNNDLQEVEEYAEFLHHSYWVKPK